jgi:hypothetical protein
VIAVVVVASGGGVEVTGVEVDVEVGPSPSVTTAVMVVEGRVRIWVTTRVRASSPRVVWAVTSMVDCGRVAVMKSWRAAIRGKIKAT